MVVRVGGDGEGGKGTYKHVDDAGVEHGDDGCGFTAGCWCEGLDVKCKIWGNGVFK